MVSKKQSSARKTNSLRNDEVKPLSLNVGVKIGILHTVADAIYASPVGKIREAVSNAVDNEATWFIIVADTKTNSLYLFDNGQGITEDRFKEIFESIGYGQMCEQSNKLSYFGLGLMSIFQLGKKVKLFTKPKQKKEMYLLEINTEEIFKPENKEKSISFLNQYLSLEKTTNEAREAQSAFPIEDFIRRELGGIPTNYTEIIIENVNPIDFEFIADPSFETELSKILPLKPDIDEPFLKRYSGNKKKDILEMLSDSIYCPTIDVFFGVRGVKINENGETENDDTGMKDCEVRQLWKYFPKFRSDLDFPDSNVIIYSSDESDFKGYIVHTVAKDLYREPVSEKENGLWIRNRNFLVKGSDFLEKPGPGKRIISSPLRTWIFGEIFHKGMNDFLTVNRNDFLFDKKKFVDFRSEVQNIVSPLDKTLRTIWEERKKIIDRVINPFVDIGNPGGTIEKAEKRLRQLFEKECPEEEICGRVSEALRNAQQPSIEDESAQIDIILSEMDDPILLGENENQIVEVDPKLKNQVQDYEVSWNSEQKKVKISISPNLFNSKEIMFLDEKYTILYVAKGKTDPGTSINIDEKKIFINPFNENLSLYSLNILDITIAIEVAHALSVDKDDLKNKFLSLIGIKLAGCQEYIAPLGDDLRRGLAYRNGGE